MAKIARRVSTGPTAWTPPPMRIVGDQLLKLADARNKIAEAEQKAKQAVAEEQAKAESELRAEVEDLKRQLKELLDDLPKLFPKAGGGRRTIIKVLKRDFADLFAIAGLSTADGNFIVGNGTTWTVESGATARASLGAAADSEVVKLTGNQTVAGTKTFSSAPVVPDASWSIAKTNGLQTALDGKQPLASNLTSLAGTTAGVIENIIEQGAYLAEFTTIASLLADSTLAYGANPNQAATGKYIRIRQKGYIYEVAASGASDHDVATAGGVKLYALPLGGVLFDEQFGLPLDGDWAGGGTEVRTTVQKWASSTRAKRKRFTGVSRCDDQITFPTGTILEADNQSQGLDFSAASSITGNICVLFDNSANLVQIADMSADPVKGGVTVTLTDASTLEFGDWFCVYNPTEWSWVSGTSVAGGRETYKAGEWARVFEVATNTVTTFGPLYAGYTAASVDVYRLRGGGSKLAGFRIKPPSLGLVAAIMIDCEIEPAAENIKIDNSMYAGIIFRRCIDLEVDCRLLQKRDSGTAGDEYALSIQSCHGFKIDGTYYSERHGIHIGNGTFTCNVPNRAGRVHADTHAPWIIQSLDFGHGCMEDIEAIGGTHDGAVISGKNIRLTGSRLRKGLGERSGVAEGGDALVINGSEFVGGDFIFTGCIIEGLASADHPDSSRDCHVNFSIQAAQTEEINLIFDNCTYIVHSGTPRAIWVNINANAYKVNVIIRGGRVIGGAGMTEFLYLRNQGGGSVGFGTVQITGLEGVPASIPMAFVNGTGPDRWVLDRQRGSNQLAGNTGATAVTSSVSFARPYPTGVTPLVTPFGTSNTLGGDRFVASATGISNTGFTLAALTADTGNFASTAIGAIGWEASVNF